VQGLLTSRHKNFYIAIALGLIAFVVTFVLARNMALAIGCNIFFLVYLVLTFHAAQKMSAAFLREHAAEEDEPAPLILLVMLAAVAASAVSLFFVLAGGNGPIPLQLVLGVMSVVLGWFAVHTMWALHYAFEYYQAPAEERSAGRKRSGKTQAGLDFPGGEEPSGASFFYFAYVIGMTAQTSDTGITSNAMRRLVLVHGVFSFFFNTVIVAAAVNIAVALAH
jgi:uncharacterized membrane protein